MAFDEKTKLIAKTRSAFRCCICYKPFVEIHHILPKSEGGPDSLENAAPLCSACHDLYGGNPEKRKTIKQMRDSWWDLMAKRRERLTATPEMDEFCEIQEESAKDKLQTKVIALYHVVFAEENFETAVNHIVDLISTAQKRFPNKPRALYLDIDEHRTAKGGYDNDMYELQSHFLLRFMFQFLYELSMPLIHVKNNKLQNNEVPDMVPIIERMDEKALNEAIDKGVSGIWLANKEKWISLK